LFLKKSGFWSYKKLYFGFIFDLDSWLFTVFYNQLVKSLIHYWTFKLIGLLVYYRWQKSITSALWFFMQPLEAFRRMPSLEHIYSKTSSYSCQSTKSLLCKLDILHQYLSKFSQDFNSKNPNNMLRPIKTDIVMIMCLCAFSFS